MTEDALSDRLACGHVKQSWDDRTLPCAPCSTRRHWFVERPPRRWSYSDYSTLPVPIPTPWSNEIQFEKMRILGVSVWVEVSK